MEFVDSVWKFVNDTVTPYWASVLQLTALEGVLLFFGSILFVILAIVGFIWYVNVLGDTLYNSIDHYAD